jgi:hypothetical protein
MLSILVEFQYPTKAPSLSETFSKASTNKVSTLQKIYASSFLRFFLKLLTPLQPHPKPISFPPTPLYSHYKPPSQLLRLDVKQEKRNDTFYMADLFFIDFLSLFFYFL